jgi:cell wall-associated NlpC family hydrolase
MHLTFDLIGKPFKDGVGGPDAFDCWGLAVEVFRRFGIKVPDYRPSCGTVAGGLIEQGAIWARCAGEIPVPALIVFTTYGLCDHVGVYLGLGRFIHAHEAAGVVITQTDHLFWKKRIEGYYAPRCF